MTIRDGLKLGIAFGPVQYMIDAENKVGGYATGISAYMCI